jgi:hypothetical protein
VIHGGEICPKTGFLESERDCRMMEPVLLKLQDQNPLQPRLGEGVS